MIDQNYCVCLSDIASQVLPSFEELQRYLAHTTCHLSEPMTAACKSMYTLLVGVPPARVNLTMIPTYFGHNPSGGSLTQFRDRALKAVAIFNASQFINVLGKNYTLGYSSLMLAIGAA